MKHKIYFILATALMISSIQTFSQALITKRDSISLANDTIVKLTIPDYRGNIQWQKSLDGQYWRNLPGEISDSVTVKPDQAAIYRAKITEGSCLPVYSDSALILCKDSVSRNVIQPQKIGLTLISDSMNIIDGKYLYVGNNNISGFEIGKVIIDEKTETIRKIIDLVQKSDTIVAFTVQASMSDLFFNTSFKLSTAMVTPSINLKNATIGEIGKALTDENGFIHPVEIVNYNSDGSILKSASIFSEKNNLGNMFFKLDWSNYKLYDYSGTFSIPNNKGVIVSYTGNIKSYISEGYFLIDPTFKFEHDFKFPGFDWKKLNFNKGGLTKFKFYLDKSVIEFKNVVSFESNIGFEFGKNWTLIKKAYSSKILFVVLDIPIYVEIDMDINCSLSVEAKGGYATSMGFQNTNYITFGYVYENNNGGLIRDFQSSTNGIASNAGFEKTGVTLSIYPSIDAKIYKAEGPFLEFGPNISYEVNKSDLGNWDKSLDIGFNLAAGVSVNIFDNEFASLKLFDNDLYTENLWEAPKKLILVSGDNQSTTQGKKLPLPITVKVLDKNNSPLDNVQVHFQPVAGSVEQVMVKTDVNGLAKTDWTMADTPGEQILKVYQLDGTDQEIPDCSKMVKATALPVDLPTITTSAISNITQTTATGGGNVTSDGGATVTARGVCWSTLPGPTTSDSKTTDGTGLGSFTSSLSGLTINTPYYVRAYATNSQGTAYGNLVTFTTPADENPIGTFTDSRDGKTYKWVKIDNQTWMADNLAYLPSVSPPSAESDTAPNYYVYGYTGSDVSAAKNNANYITYGVLYNWPAALTACPAGWHLPSDAEWTILITYLGGHGNAGGKMKETGTTHWYSPNTGATNESGFSGLPGGYRYFTGTFVSIGYYGNWWSSAEYSSFLAFYCSLLYDFTLLYWNYFHKDYGFSVRCLRD
jgi:uncharacterized protein (TIGR02145 family)